MTAIEPTSQLPPPRSSWLVLVVAIICAIALIPPREGLTGGEHAGSLALAIIILSTLLLARWLRLSRAHHPAELGLWESIGAIIAIGAWIPPLFGVFFGHWLSPGGSGWVLVACLVVLLGALVMVVVGMRRRTERDRGSFGESRGLLWAAYGARWLSATTASIAVGIVPYFYIWLVATTMDGVGPPPPMEGLTLVGWGLLALYISGVLFVVALQVREAIRVWRAFAAGAVTWVARV